LSFSCFSHLEILWNKTTYIRWMLKIDVHVPCGTSILITCHSFISHGLGWHSQWIVKESSCSFDDDKVYESTCDILWQCMYHVCRLFSFADHPV